MGYLHLENAPSWHVMWLLTVAVIHLGFFLLILALFGRLLNLSGRVRCAIGIGLLIVIVACIIGAYKLNAINNVAFEAAIFWPAMGLLENACLLTGAISLLLLVVSLLSWRQIRNPGPLSVLILLLIAVGGYCAVPPMFDKRTVWMRNDDYYYSGVQSILRNEYPKAKREFGQYANNAAILASFPNFHYGRLKPYVGKPIDLMASIDGGTLSQKQISDCRLRGHLPSISYAIRPAGSYIILLNIFSDGRVYLLTRTGASGSQCGVSAGEIAVPDDILDLMRQDITERTLIYQCPACCEQVITAYLQDPAFAENASIQVDRLGSLEYYNLCCNGRQVNGYWEPDASRETPPWTTFRQAIMDVINETLERGSTISVGTYLSGIREAEGQYGFRSLTGYEWSKFYIETTFELGS